MKRWLTAGITVTVLLMFFSGWEIASFFIESGSLEKQALLGIIEKAGTAQKNLEALIARFGALADRTAEEIGRLGTPDESFLRRLREIGNANPDLYTIGVAFPPFSEDLGLRNKTPFLFTRNASDSQLYGKPIVITRPVRSADLTVPATGTGGLVFIEIPARQIQELFLVADYGETSYSFILEKTGHYLWHPNQDFVFSEKTVFQRGVENKQPAISMMAKEAVDGKEGLHPFLSIVTQKESWGHYKPIAGTDLSLFTITSREELYKPTLTMERRLFLGTTFFMLGLTSLLFVWAFRPAEISDHRLWVLSVLVSLVFTCGIGVLWYLQRTFAEGNLTGSPPVYDKNILGSFMKDHAARSKQGGLAEPVFIPTGCLIRSIQFESGFNVKVTGQVWQKIPKHSLASWTGEGVTFPEAIESDFQKAFEREDDRNRTIGWNFTATLRLGLNYRAYPFETQRIWIRMLARDFDQNVVLTPDLESYKLMNPGLKPGVEPNIALPGWEVTASTFNFVPTEFNTNFGIPGFSGRERFPVLFFNITIKREFLDPLVSQFLPLFVVTALVFCILLINTKDGSMASILGHSASLMTQISCYLVLVVIYAQIDIRQRLEVQRIIYLDFFYFVNYLVFLVLSLTPILFTMTDRFPILQYRDCLVPKLLFWPAISGIYFLITLVFFYP